MFKEIGGSFILFWLFLSAIPGFIAGRKGRSIIGFFLLSVVLTPLIGLIAALIISPLAQAPNEDNISKLEHLSKLRESGALSEEEFNTEKAKILGNTKPEYIGEGI